MACESADVERTCKVNKIIHTKSRNRLNNTNVARLIFCYVNLRLLKSLNQGEVDLDKDNTLENFLADAALINTDPEDVNGDDEEEVIDAASN